MTQSEPLLPSPTRRPVPNAFTSKAVRLTRESGRPVARRARELRMADTLRSHWRSDLRQASPQGQSRQSRRAGQSERARLKRGHATLQPERALLRRTVRFFAKESP